MRSLITTVALAGCCFAAGAALADGAHKSTQRGPAGIAEGEALLLARAKLLKQGWRPTRRHSSDGYEYSGAELQLTGHKIFEVDSCSTDSSRCILYYSKKGKCLRMDSIGEQLRDMTVTRWADECPDALPKASVVATD